MKVVGLDLSLTSTGVAVATEHGAVTDRITSSGRKDATLADRQARLHNLRLDIALMAAGADLVVVEGPSYGQTRQGGQHDRAGLWWLVVDWLVNAEPDGWQLRVVEVPPAVRAKYATGKGNAAKDDVLSAVIRRYPAVDVNGNDEADALVLAAMGARHLGHPLEPAATSDLRPVLPATHLDAMTKVAWPDDVRSES